MKITPETLSFILGTTTPQQLSVEVKPSNASNPAVTWKSNNESIATVDVNGLVTAVAGGKTDITATADGKTSTCAVTVNVPVTEVRIDQEGPVTLAVGQKKQFTAKVKPTNTTSKVTWTSNNGTVAEINASTGEVTAKAKGPATITATADGKTSTCDLEIVDPVNVTGVKFDKTTLNLNVDSVATLTASFTPSNATNKAVTFTSSDGNIVEITSITQDTIIKIKALKTGTANITVKTADGNKTATCKITVPAVLVTKVKLDKNSIPSLLIGDSVTLKATITPTNASNQTVTWKSDNAKIATVSTDGKVKGVAAGKTFIVVSSSNDKVKDTCTVEVAAVVVPVTGVKFRKDTINIIEKDTIRLIADILPANATNKNLNWVSKNESAVTVSNTGIVKGIKAGQSLIIVSTQNNDKKDTCVVNVRERVLIIDPEVPAQGSKGSIPLSLNVPDKETITGTFTIKFPAGVTLDIENTKLTEAFAAASSLTITGGSNNTWKVEIKKKDLKSMLRAFSNQKIMDIAYTITKNVKKGDLLDVNIANAAFKFSDNSEIKEDGMTFRLKADYTTGNSLISSENGYAYKTDNRLFIQSPKAETIYVYTFGGALLYTNEKIEGEVSFDLNVQEPVIVKGSSGWTQKVAK